MSHRISTGPGQEAVPRIKIRPSLVLVHSTLLSLSFTIASCFYFRGKMLPKIQHEMEKLLKSICRVATH